MSWRRRVWASCVGAIVLTACASVPAPSAVPSKTTPSTITRSSAPSIATPIEPPTTSGRGIPVTITFSWDRRCNASWMLRFAGEWWKATDLRATWGESFDTPRRNGTAEVTAAGFLRYQDDDGTVVDFVIDDAAETACS